MMVANNMKGEKQLNSKELKIEMMRHNETGEHLAKYLKISRQTLSNKMSENQNTEFTQQEIAKIKEHYDLSSDRVVEIFFA